MNQQETALNKAAHDSVQPFFLIAICTRNRPKHLKRLLRSIALQTDWHDLARATLLIADNNDTPTIPSNIAGPDFPIDVTVTHVPIAGLAPVRNATLEYAENVGADWLLGLDDDGWVESDWLAEFAQACRNAEEDILIGNWNHVYGPGTSALLKNGPRARLRDPYEPTIYTTCNFAFSRRIFASDDGLGLRFDASFSDSGGEDTELMLRAKRKHQVRIAKAQKAIFHEERTGKRATLWDHLLRMHGYQVVGYKIAAHHRKHMILKDPKPLSLILYRRTARYVIAAIWNTARALVALPFNRSLGQRRLLRGLESFAEATAVITYLFARPKNFYGQSVPPAEKQEKFID